MNTLVLLISQTAGAFLSSSLITNQNAAPTFIELVRTNVLSNLVTRSILHPRQLVSTIGNGVRGGANIISNRPVESHAILRTTNSVLAEEFSNVVAAQQAAATLAQEGTSEVVVEAINSGTENVISSLRNSLSASMQTQRSVIIVSTLLPIIALSAFIWLKNPNSSNSMLNIALEKIPSKEYIAETIKTELAVRTPVIKPAVLSVTAQQVLLVGGTGILFGGVLVILVLKLNENYNVKLRKAV
jgi:hypothetical protein